MISDAWNWAMWINVHLKDKIASEREGRRFWGHLFMLPSTRRRYQMEQCRRIERVLRDSFVREFRIEA